MFKRKKTIYLDYAASTPINIKVLKRVSFLNNEYLANPNAIHSSGVITRGVIEESRNKIASLLNAHSDEIVFTGSGTESDALAVLGVITNYELLITNEKLEYKIPHIITTKIEHPAVLENIRLLLESNRVEVTYIPVGENGIVNPRDIRDALKENTILVSVMYANNEIGTIEPIEEIVKEIRHFRKGKKAKRTVLKRASPRTVLDETDFPVFHTDATQAMNYLFVENIEKLGVDMMTFNGSKIYGPKGIGVLYKKRGINLSPLYLGGGQEFGLRSGTESVALVGGIALALEEVLKIKEKEVARLNKLRDYGIDKLLSLEKETGYKIILNGDRKNRLPNNINISISDISSELLVIELDARGIEVSEKSACHSIDENSSHVIRAIRKTCGRKKEGDSGSIRISLGQMTSKKDIDYLVASLSEILKKYKDYKF